MKRTDIRYVMKLDARLASLSAKAALAVILASLPVLASCAVSARSGDGSRSVADQTMNQRSVEVSLSGGGVIARAGDAKAQAGEGAVARAGDAVARAGAGAVARAGDVEVRAGDAEAQTNAHSEGTSRKVTLEIRGERGTRFTGKCSVGSEERHVGGQVPKSYSFDLGGKKLECEIRKDGPGTLEVELSSGNNVRSMQRQTGTGNSVIRLTYSGDGASSFSSSQSQVSSASDSTTRSR